MSFCPRRHDVVVVRKKKLKTRFRLLLFEGLGGLGGLGGGGGGGSRVAREKRLLFPKERKSKIFFGILGTSTQTKSLWKFHPILDHETLNEKKGTPSRQRHNTTFGRRCTFLSSFGVEFTRARIYHAHTVVKNTARISPTLSLRRTFICTSRFTRYFRKNVHDDCDSASCGCGDERCARHFASRSPFAMEICASSSHRRKFLSRGGAWTRGSKRRTRIANER